MSGVDLAAISPLMVMGYGGTLLTLLAAFRWGRRLTFGFTLATLAAAFGAMFVALPYAPRAVTPLLQIDSYALYFIGLILAASFLVTLLCPQYARAHARRPDALYVLIVFATLGMMTLAASNHFVSFFLGLEILSVSLYGLIGYTRSCKQSIEGAIKYLILAATASAFLLFGIALIYADTGTMDFRRLALIVGVGHASYTSLFGLALMLAGFGFKLALVPFHMWSPDVYQGAPAPVTALIATGSKGAVFALLLRLVSMAGLKANHRIFVVLTVLAVTTMTVGNLLALLQTNVKRLLAYSSIAHMGYLLIPLVAGGPAGPSSIAFYLAAYFATTIAAFGVIAVASASRERGDVEEIEDYRGFSSRNPVMAAIMTLALLSLTGIPLTAGFLAKFYIFSAAAQAGLWMLLIVGVVNAGMAAFYYLRVIVAMYAPALLCRDFRSAELHSNPETTASSQQPFPRPDITSGIALAVATGVIVFFGVYPTPLIRLVEAVTRGMGR